MTLSPYVHSIQYIYDIVLVHTVVTVHTTYRVYSPQSVVRSPAHRQRLSFLSTTARSPSTVGSTRLSALHQSCCTSSYLVVPSPPSSYPVVPGCHLYKYLVCCTFFTLLFVPISSATPTPAPLPFSFSFPFPSSSSVPYSL